MIYLTSITVLVCLLLVVTMLGKRIACLLPGTFRDSVEFYIAPLLGLAGIVLITAVYGWLSPFKTSISISLAVGLLLLGIWFEKQRADLFRDWLIISAFAIVATIPILAPALRFDGFNPCTDIFTYLVHGQWLQVHAFSEAARASGFYPVETQVALYQAGGHRMSASFFLGFVQSLFHLEWSYYAFLPTVGLVFAVGSLAMGGVIRQVLPVSKTVCLALCTLPAFSMNGFVFGAQWGFFPQTFGLAFVAGLACLIPGLVTDTLHTKPSWVKKSLNLLPLAICCSALLTSYPEIFPIVSAGFVLFLLLAFAIYWGEKYHIMGFVLILLVQVLAVTNVAGFRIVKNFFHTVLSTAAGNVSFGWPMYWSPVQFLAHSFGMKSPFQSDVFLIDRIISLWVFPVILIIIIAILTKILRAKPRNLTVLFLLCMDVIFLLAFIKFRYASPGLEREVGHTFLQFKIAKWAAPINLALLSIVIAWILLKAGSYRCIFKYAFLATFIAGMAIQYVIVSPTFTKQFQDETMRKYSSFNVLLELRSRVENIPRDQVIYLSFGAAHHKLRQMVAYVLSDRKLASKYDDDGYLLGTIPGSERNMPLDTAEWMIQLKPMQTIDENPLNRVGPFIIRRAPFNFFSLESVSGGYATETDNKNSWNWVKNYVEYHFHRVGQSNQVRVKFEFTGNPGTLFLQLKSTTGAQVASFKIPMNVGWGKYESPLINSNSGDIIIQIKASGKPVRLSAGDPREVQFLIQNISLESSL